MYRPRREWAWDDQAEQAYQAKRAKLAECTIKGACTWSKGKAFQVIPPRIKASINRGTKKPGTRTNRVKRQRKQGIGPRTLGIIQ